MSAVVVVVAVAGVGGTCGTRWEDVRVEGCVVEGREVWDRCRSRGNRLAVGVRGRSEGDRVSSGGEERGLSGVSMAPARSTGDERTSFRDLRSSSFAPSVSPSLSSSSSKITLFFRGLALPPDESLTIPTPLDWFPFDPTSSGMGYRVSPCSDSAGDAKSASSFAFCRGDRRAATRGLLSAARPSPDLFRRSCDMNLCFVQFVGRSMSLIKGLEDSVFRVVARNGRARSEW